MERIATALERLRPSAAQGSRAPERAAVARLQTLDREALRERRVILPGDADAAAHAYRMLRSQVLKQSRSHDLRLIGVASCVDGEGKTLTAANLALSIAAEPNQTVLLVDLDLRRPGVAQLLGLDVSEGLEAWFEGRASVSDLFVQLEGVPRLRVLPTFAPVAGSSEALAAGRTRDLVGELKTRYDDRLVIIDLPPVLLADDMLTLAPLLDGVLILVSEGRTRRDDITRITELLNGVRIMGTVLNISAESEQRRY